MLIRPDILPDILLEDLPDEARAVREAWVPSARGKLVAAAGGRRAYSCTNFMHWTSTPLIKVPSPM